MPISLTSRRRFLAQSIGALSFSSLRLASADPGSPPTWVLAADTHINADPAKKSRGVNLTDHLQRAVKEILAHPTDFAGVIINGDCAHIDGQAGDYTQLASLTEPLLKAGLDLHLTMGNHDDRGPFRKSFARAAAPEDAVEDKHIAVIETPQANWILLDSLWKVNVVTGQLGEPQLRWLEALLDRYPDKPAILIGHHNPQFEPKVMKDGKELYTGLADSTQLFDLLHRKPQVQAYVFGHTHNWNVTRSTGGIQLVNLPPVSYVFDAERPSGWVKATATDAGLNLQLQSLLHQHPQHEETLELAWR